ncbi:MAG: enolase C-terminal domain-like protein [Trebonia sp.]
MASSPTSSAAADLDVRWLEEPVSSDDLDGLREVRDAVQADVTAGEYGYDLTYFRRMCAAGAVDCLQADVSRCGGITEWLRAAAVAASYVDRGQSAQVQPGRDDRGEDCAQ